MIPPNLGMPQGVWANGKGFSRHPLWVYIFVIIALLAGVYLPDSWRGFGIAASGCALIPGVVCLILFNNILGVKGMEEFYGYFGSASQNLLARLPPPPPGMMLTAESKF